jgi:hypothetical protein
MMRTAKRSAGFRPGGGLRKIAYGAHSKYSTSIVTSAEGEKARTLPPSIDASLSRAAARIRAGPPLPPRGFEAPQQRPEACACPARSGLAFSARHCLPVGKRAIRRNRRAVRRHLWSIRIGLRHDLGAPGLIVATTGIPTNPHESINFNHSITLDQSAAKILGVGTHRRIALCLPRRPRHQRSCCSPHVARDLALFVIATLANRTMLWLLTM